MSVAAISARIYIDPVFVKTSPKRSILVIENERFGLVFAKTGSINSGTGIHVPTGFTSSEWFVLLCTAVLKICRLVTIDVRMRGTLLKDKN